MLAILTRIQEVHNPLFPPPRLVAEINEVTLLYPAPQRAKQPVVQTQFSKMNDLQKKLASVLGLDRSLHN
jgi:hypothetical protein